MIVRKERKTFGLQTYTYKHIEASSIMVRYRWGREESGRSRREKSYM